MTNLPVYQSTSLDPLFPCLPTSQEKVTMAEKSSDLAKDDLYKLRHSAAHVMAQAVLGSTRRPRSPSARHRHGLLLRLRPGQGRGRQAAHLHARGSGAIEKRMRQIIGGKHPFVYRQVSADEARQLFDRPALQAGADRRAGEGRHRRVRQRDRRAAGHQHLQAGHASRISAAGRTWSTRARSRRTPSS